MDLPVKYDCLSWQERRAVREEYIRLQKGICCHCGSPLKEEPSSLIMAKQLNTRLFPKNFFKWPVHLHHNHTTGTTIGAVHNICNAVLWQYHGE